MLLHDIRYALRQMARSPAFTAAAVCTLALAVGANTAMFSVVYGVLMRPLPYRDADRIVRLSEEHPGGTPLVRDAVLSNLTFDAWSRGPQTIEGLAAYSSRAYTVGIADGSRRLEGAAVSPGLFELLGAVPAAGRFFLPEEGRDGAPQVAVLSHGAWERYFGADPAVIGVPIRIDGQPHVVVGVGPRWFYFPDRDAELWTPYVATPPREGNTRIVWALARLRPGATLQQAEAEGTAAARTVKRPVSATLMFGEGGPVQVRARLLSDQTTAQIRPALLVMTAGVGFVLLIACANVASLLLARGVARTRELSVRAALGASRSRLIAQLLTESVLLSMIGGGAGVLLAWLLTGALPLFAPESFPRLGDVRLDGLVLGFAALASTLAGVLAGLLPALRRTSSLSLAMRQNDSRSHGPRRDVLRAGLLAGEAAVGVVLLVGASLLGRSFVALVSVDPGYEPRNLLVARVYREGPGRAERARSQQFVNALVERLRAGPGVLAAGAANMIPLGESSYISGFDLPGAGPAGETVFVRAQTYVITPGYAEALGLRLRDGRFFTDADATHGWQRVIANRALVRTYLKKDGPAVGRAFNGGLVGIVDDVRREGLDVAPQPAIFLPHGGEHGIEREVNVVIRTAGDPLEAVPFLRSVVRDLDPTAALGQVGPMAGQIARSVAEPRFAAIAISAFAAIALLLAAAGLYGVLSYHVTQRRREIGVRSALGASPRRIVGLVVRQGVAVTVVGVIIGLAAAAALAPGLRRLLFGIEPIDPLSFVLAPVVLLLVGILACLLPARRAASVDPAEALRSE
ncbi:MAG TPA: ABC transporter permease [Vicinamibacterales bacterium]|nr:ABC transporter permease [Vicinamibacterales bacterium]